MASYYQLCTYVFTIRVTYLVIIVCITGMMYV